MTRDDVAQAAGTSTAVVSYVVNGGPRPVSATTRARVLAAVAELGYRPNSVARSLRSNRSHTLGVVVDGWDATAVELLAGAEGVAAEHNLRLFVGCGDSAEATNQHVRAFVDHRADGILLLTGHVGESVGAELVRSETPAVAVGGALHEGPVLGLPSFDDLPERARAHLDDHGCERTVLIEDRSAPRPSATSFDAELSLEEFLVDSTTSVSTGIVCTTPTVARAVHAHTRGGVEPTCVVAIDEGSDPPSTPRPGLAVLRAHRREQGALAARSLLEIVMGDAPQPAPTVPEPRVVCSTAVGAPATTRRASE